MSGLLRASRFEYEHRYLLHGAIYTLGLAAPWQLPVWGFVANGSSWFLLANALAKPTYLHFAFDWNLIAGTLVAFAAAGAFLRTWGAAYLGATTVHRGGMEGDRVVADGPYRYVRNPLYLGTILHSVSLCMLMRPAAAIGAFLLIVMLQLRLIGREEPYLTETKGLIYDFYRSEVPRLLPRLRSALSRGEAHPRWQQGILSEIYMIGVAVSFAVAGWSGGFDWERTVLHVISGVVIALGVSVVARAFIPKAQM